MSGETGRTPHVPGNPWGPGSVKGPLGWTRVADRNTRKRPSGNAIKLLAFTLCVFTVCFVVVSTSHIHPNGQEDAACPFCQVAHVGISAALVTLDLPVPLVERAEVQKFAPFFHSALFLPSSSPRAPPSA